MTSDNRIYFPNNPWPEGHPIKEFKFFAEFSGKDGMVLHLHLKSTEYYAERDIPGFDEDDNDLFEDAGEFGHPDVWCNYHACTLSSTYWGHRGIPIKKKSAYDMHDFMGVFEPDKNIKNDHQVEEHEDYAFDIYLMGHDSVANHHIKIQQNSSGSDFNINWRGKICLSYIGREDFEYDFHLHKSNIRFEGVWLSDVENEKDARILADKHFKNPEQWRIEMRHEHNKDQYYAQFDTIVKPIAKKKKFLFW